jgi:ArsR family transcriptional regulator
MSNCKTQCGEIVFDNTSKNFEFLAHPLRLKILCGLSKCDAKSCWEIVEALWLAQNLVSHHLGILRKSWLVNTEKKWKFIFYSINKEVFWEFQNDLKDIFGL